MEAFSFKNEDLPHYTINEWELWDGKWELIQGIPYAMSPMANRKHQFISGKIITELNLKLNCIDCSVYPPIDWQINEETILEPDVSIVCGECNGHYLTYPPELIFEILSPSTALKDRNLKFQIYLSQKVKFYIIINPIAEKGEVYQLEGEDYVKKGEFTQDQFLFEWNDCHLNFEFSKIWK